MQDYAGAVEWNLLEKKPSARSESGDREGYGIASWHRQSPLSYLSLDICELPRILWCVCVSVEYPAGIQEARLGNGNRAPIPTSIN